jgi:hypothetical protein
MNNAQKVMTGIVLLLAVVFVYEWKQVKNAENGPAKLVTDINDHAYGGVMRADLEPYLEQRGGDVAYDVVEGGGRTSGVDHVVFRNIRHLGESTENLNADFYYDQGNQLIYYSLRRVWDKPKH